MEASERSKDASESQSIMTTVRRRRNDQEATEIRAKKSDQSTHTAASSLSYPQRPKTVNSTASQPAHGVWSSPASYHVAKWAILRLLGVVYWFAFLGAYYQNEGLIGQFGLQPASIAPLERNSASSLQGFVRHPTVFWWIAINDANFKVLYILGLVFSTIVVLGVNSWLLQLMLWMMYFSILTVAQSSSSFYSYGWESQLLETGFLSVFLCQFPLFVKGALDWSLYERRYEAPSPIVLWLLRWLMFRISLGAGLIKVRGSSCWKTKTCLHYHFETQPIPSPLSFVYHFLPTTVQTRMVDVDLWVQLYTSPMVLIPVGLVRQAQQNIARQLLRVGSFLQVAFMVGIMLSGNFAFLNHLTVVPALAGLDDDFVPQFLRDSVLRKCPPKVTPTDPIPTAPSFTRSRRWIDLGLLSVILYLSWPVVANLVQLQGSRQLMNASFDPFRLVNTYGAFGSVGHERYEAIVQVNNGTHWIELEWPCKPGNLNRRPCFCAPYHYRLDWNIWFLGFPPHQSMLRQREGWMMELVQKLLQPQAQPRPWLYLLDPTSAELLRSNFYNHHRAPLAAKVDMYHYQMNKALWGLLMDWIRGRKLVWWNRRYHESLIPAVVWNSQSSRLQMAAADIL